MLETSKDVLFITLSGCVLILTFFLCWAIFYIVMMLKRAHLAIKEISELIASFKEKLEHLEGLVKTIEEKIKHTASYLPLLLKGITELIEFIKRRKEERISKKKNK